MSEISDVLTRYAQAWAAGDLAGLRACYHPDLTLHYFGANPLSGDHVGLEASLTALAEVSRRTQRQLIEIVDVLPGERRGAVIVRERMGRGDETFEIERVLTYTVRDGLLHECWGYDQDQALIDRLLA